MQNSNNHSKAHKTGYEKRDVNVWLIIGLAVATVIILAGMILVLNEYYISEKEELVYEYTLKPESSELRDIRAREEQVLNNYRVIDAQNDIYQIPIERAMQLLADEYYQQRLAENN